MRAAASVGNDVPKLCATDTLKAFGSCRLCLVEIEGRRGYPASCTTLVADGIKVRTESPKLTQLRRSVMELYLSDHPADCGSTLRERPLRAAGHGRRSSASPDRATASAARTTCSAAKDESNPYFTFDQSECIVCSRCVRACDEVQGTFALTIQGRGFDSKVSASQNESFLAVGMRLVRRLRRSVPDRRAGREVAHPDRRADQGDDDHLRVLRRRLLVQRRVEERRGRADGAEPRRPRQPRPRLRQGPLRLRLRDASRPHHHADDPQVDRRSVAAGHLGRGDRPRGERVQAHPGEVRPRLDRRHHVVALHERRDVPRAEARARGVRQQQRGHLRARLPFADRLRPEEHHRRIRGHAGLRLGDEGRRHHRRRRESDRRPSGVRLAAEAAPAPGREADRHRSARDRAGADAAHRGATTTCRCVPAPTSPCSTRSRTSS